MREKLVTELVKEVLGPRNGIDETLDESPLREYVTGVLAPISGRVIPEIDSEAEIPAEDTQIYEEETADVDVSVPPLFYPALDPKSKPSTMGLSFVLEAAEIPEVHVCLTWARYATVKEKKDGKPSWRREPRYATFSQELHSNQNLWFDESGKRVDLRSQAEISFHIIVSPFENNRHFISLYLVNRITLAKGQNVAAEHCIFQPQIRVVCGERTRLVPGVRRAPKWEDEQKLEFLHRHRPVLAKGHLSSAVWKDIDPENDVPNGVNVDLPECRNEPPFAWLDGNLLSTDQRELFSHADVRTEFVPMYSIPFPELDWKPDYGRPPELNACSLSEIWKPEILRDALSPLSSAYERWTSRMESKIDTLVESEKDGAKNLITECRNVLDRIKKGIDVLCSDDDARLAFCLANKAIDIQWKWSRKSDFTWRPFQMGFILMTLESIVNPESEYRKICDLLWVPTGAGKTEAYLAIVAFGIAYRRRKARKRANRELTGAGVSVITRYTLRLLTIQQFRRTLSVVTACECLRIHNVLQKKPIGWRPSDCPIKSDFLWGSTPFTIGLWVGGAVSPNRLGDTWGGNQIVRGALSILKGEQGEGEPAQVLNCPACNAILAVPQMGLQPGQHTIHFVIHTEDGHDLGKEIFHLKNQKFQNVAIDSASAFQHTSQGFNTLTLKIGIQNTLQPRTIEEFWKDIERWFLRRRCKAELVPVRASRPGYFERYYRGRGTNVIYDFELFCPNPECPLHRPWIGGAPTGWAHGRHPHRGYSPDGISLPLFMDGNCLIDVQEPFVRGEGKDISDRIPIPALTVEEQTYRRLPTIVVATVDKFARPPFEPRASALFGNVEYHHSVYGYYRRYQPSSPASNSDGHPIPAGSGRAKNYDRLYRPPEPPDLIIQDELHLIEGPLGSLAGIYETAIDFLCSEGRNYPAKYIASTATIRRAAEQIRAVFLRGLQQFPPHGLTADERFFITEREIHALDDMPPGRLYLGVCAPGRGPHTPIVRIWGRLLQTVWQCRKHPGVDLFWTLTGYFNAVRELAGARALYRQDIPQMVDAISASNPRSLSDERSHELSSRTPSTDLPSILHILNREYPEAPDALFTTSMFGTGVDIPRIGLMVVNGQPKTTSAYIQSTGRVGRSKGALVVTFYRATRPRDLSHYEFFAGYHRQLHRFVEPITVYPFSTGVLDRTIGPVTVFLLRNMRSQTVDWHKDDTAPSMATLRTTALEVQDLPRIVDRRAQGQPPLRKPASRNVPQDVNSKLDRWQLFAARDPNLKYVEYAISVPPQFPVVLGDYQHQHSGLDVVYENAPRSLRDIEETTGFQT